MTKFKLVVIWITWMELCHVLAGELRKVTYNVRFDAVVVNIEDIRLPEETQSEVRF